MEEVLHEAPQVEIADDEVKLSDGRVVKMRETTGADEAAVSQMLGDHVSLQGAGAVVLTQANAIKAIVSIDGQILPPIRSYNEYLGRAREFKTKDLNKIVTKYAEMNLEAVDGNPLV